MAQLEGLDVGRALPRLPDPLGEEPKCGET